MKRTGVIRLLVVVVVMIGTLVLSAGTAKAGADTTSTPVTESCSVLTSQPPAATTPVTMVEARHPASEVNADCIPGDTNGPITNLGVTFGWAIYMHLTHENVGEVEYTAIFIGWIAAFGVVCGALAAIDIVAGAACAVMVAELGWFIPSVVEHAWSHDKGVVFWNVYFTNLFGYNYAAAND